MKILNRGLQIGGDYRAIGGTTYLVYTSDQNGNATNFTGTTAQLPVGAPGIAVGATYIASDTGTNYVNTGSVSSCLFSIGDGLGGVQVAQVNLNPAAIIVGTSIPLIAAPGAGKYIQLISATMSYTYSTAAYTGGGATSIALGTTVLTGTIAAASSLGKASNAIVQFEPLSTAGDDLSGLTATALNINVASGAYTNPGTAAGTAKVYVTYLVLTA